MFNKRQILVNSDIGSEGEKVIPGLKEPTFVTEDIYRVVNFLDLTDCVDNKYWSIPDGGSTLMQRAGTYCSCLNHPIELIAGMRYTFSSGLLWAPTNANMCYLASREVKYQHNIHFLYLKYSMHQLLVLYALKDIHIYIQLLNN